MLIRLCAFLFAVLTLVTLAVDGLHWSTGRIEGFRSASGWVLFMSPATYAWLQGCAETLLPEGVREAAHRLILDWPAAGVLAVPAALFLALLPFASVDKD